MFQIKYRPSGRNCPPNTCKLTAIKKKMRLLFYYLNLFIQCYRNSEITLKANTIYKFNCTIVSFVPCLLCRLKSKVVGLIPDLKPFGVAFWMFSMCLSAISPGSLTFTKSEITTWNKMSIRVMSCHVHLASNTSTISAAETGNAGNIFIFGGCTSHVHCGCVVCGRRF